MSDVLHMTEMAVEPLALIRFAQAHGHNRQDDEDLGYALHAWLAAAFGELAPKPFRLLKQTTDAGLSRILAYGKHDRNTLVDHMQAFAAPGACTVCPADRVSSKAMPLSWHTGRVLGFEVLTCPVTRTDATEKDVYLRRADRHGAEAGLRREDVYREWLSDQIGDSAEVVSASLAGFRLIRIHRRGARMARPLIRPQALLEGRLRITQPEGFSRLVERGVGRHRAFGYGMLLLRPA